jgi:hypothetical protein
METSELLPKPACLRNFDIVHSTLQDYLSFMFWDFAPHRPAIHNLDFLEKVVTTTYTRNVGIPLIAGVTRFLILSPLFLTK